MWSAASLKWADESSCRTSCLYWSEGPACAQALAVVVAAQRQRMRAGNRRRLTGGRDICERLREEGVGEDGGAGDGRGGYQVRSARWIIFLIFFRPLQAIWFVSTWVSLSVTW